MQLSGEENVGQLALTVVGEHFVILGRHNVIEVEGPSQTVDGGGQSHHATTVSQKEMHGKLREDNYNAHS